MNVLLIGSGGRENALAYKFSGSNYLTKLFCAPGNPGTEDFAQNLNINIKDFSQIKKAVLENSIEIVVSGPEDPLVNGLRDFIENDKDLSGVLFVGPDKIGAQLEGSKDFAKQFMAKFNVPTAQYKSFSKETIADAFSFLNSLSAPYVLKADGLAGGKGVLILDSIDEAKSELEKMFAGKFGTAGEKVVIEQFLSGIELSVFILTDGKDYLILPEAKDYKRIFDGDKGLNTGGMGAVSPVPFATKEFLDKVEKRIIIPTVKGLESENIKFNGFLFIGLMNCQGEPYVIEYNVRMGDPETEAVVPRIKSDLLGHLISMCRGKLSEEKIEISEIQALSVVCVSGGYPEEFKKGYEITGLEKLEKGLIFHAGTILKDGKLVTNGGRVLVLTVMENSILSARKSIYKQIMNFQFDNIHFRNDIGLDLIK